MYRMNSADIYKWTKVVTVACTPHVKT